MFSVGNLYLVPTINGEVKTGSGEGLCATLAILHQYWGHNLIEENPHSHQLASSYFIKRSKLTRLCSGSRHNWYTD